ncbi:MAG: hypothetical protein KBC98_00090 [Candidatus Pacebacteria bacterium]|nr:hypothetical protein [Candidatus Paceibacterota bacterium]
MKTTFSNKEIQPSPISKVLKSCLDDVLHNDFFSEIKNQKISLKGYQLFVKEKYSAVGYFIQLLEQAERLSENVSHDLAEVFRNNRLDELGYFAGKIKHEYRHETWRLRSLELFGITKKDLKGLQITTSRKHEDIMVGLSKSKDIFEVIGALLFLELFVVYEMKNLIAAFERDLSKLFPKSGYSYDRFPFNQQEYWYGHALHDTWHYRAIEEAVLANLGTGKEKKKSLQSLERGIKKVCLAKKNLYSKKLLVAMIKAEK